MRRSGPSLTLILFLAIAASAVTAQAALAGPDGLLGASSYWYNFKKFWGGIFGSVGGVVGIALGVGAVSLFIITRGKWKK